MVGGLSVMDSKTFLLCIILGALLAIAWGIGRNGARLDILIELCQPEETEEIHFYIDPQELSVL